MAAKSDDSRYTLVDRPNDADAVLLTDVGLGVSHVRFRAELLRLLTHPLVVRYRSRCFIYYENDVPRPYLPGIYVNMEWFPEVHGIAGAIGPRGVEPSPNPYMRDDPPPQARDLLFSFMGRNCHPVRDCLLNMPHERDDVLLVDTSDLYGHYDSRQDEALQRDYVDVMRRSRWAVCPRGWSATSLRLFEAMRLGIAPVVLSDSWLRPAGPDWERCCLWRPEADCADLVDVLKDAGDSWREIGHAAQEAYQRFFSEERMFAQSMEALEALLSRWRAQSAGRAIVGQIRELAAHVPGFTSPSLTRARGRGLTAISHARSLT